MKNTLNWISRNLHLIISLSIVVPTAIIYGSAPSTLLPRHLDIQVTTVDLSNFLRAIMCLYLGISFIWILGILKIEFWKIATQLNILFMITLGTGRLLSMVLDGLPSGGYIFGVIAELVLGFYSAYYNTPQF
jgi:hypothetical protein